jgi:succinoglycan biosynthesis transport protein ExoP
MLQNNKPISFGRANPSAPDFSSPAELLESFVHFLRQQYGVILSVSLLTMAIGVIYLVTTPSSFTAVATMLIDTRKAQSFQQQPLYSDAQIDSASIESQVRILKSDIVGLSVIKNLRLNEDPEFIGSDWGGVVASEYDVMRRALGVLASRLNVKRFIGSGWGGVVASEYDVMRRALVVLASRLNVKRDGLSYVIELSFRSYDADKAARIANAIVDAYIVDQLDAKYQSTLRASTWLQDRIRDLRAQASAGEQAVVDFKREHNIIDAAGKSTIGQRLGEINSQLIIVRAQTAEARARLDRIQTVLSFDSSGAVNATVTDTLKSEVVTKLRSQYLELASRASDWSARYGHEHLAAVNLRNQMREIQSAIIDELRRLAESYKSDFEIAKQRENDIQKEYDKAAAQAEKTNQAQVVLKDLESSSQTFRALYENFLNRYMESVQQQSFPITEARLISPAARPLKKSHPKTFLVLAIAACVGIIFGIGIGVLRDLWDRVFRTAEQVETILQTTCIALVPLLKRAATPALPLVATQTEEALSPRTIVDKDNVLSTVDDSPVSHSAESDRSIKLKRATTPVLPLVATQTEEALNPRNIVHDDNALWTVVDSPFSRFAESIRSIKVAADLNEIVKLNKVIGFTSSLPMEGKSTVAAALALLIAQAGGRVILVDCDLRNPSLTRTLAPSAKAGFIEVISEKAAIEDVLWTDPKTNLSFLPAVMKSRVAHTNEILASAATKNLFDELCRRYEYIIVDLPPLAPVVDVRTTTHFVNSYVFVIEWGGTKIDVVKKVLADAPGVYENLLGAVLNKTDVSRLNRYEAHRGAYYDNKHYARYGYTD